MSFYTDLFMECQGLGMFGEPIRILYIEFDAMKINTYKLPSSCHSTMCFDRSGLHNHYQLNFGDFFFLFKKKSIEIINNHFCSCNTLKQHSHIPSYL